MMGIDVFALWKFKNIEGKLKHFYASEFLVTKYINGSKKFTITYDVATQTATIKTDCIDFKDRTCSFKELPDVLRDMGVYELEDPQNCHSSAFVPLDLK